MNDENNNGLANGAKALFTFVGGVAVIVLAVLLFLAVVLGGFNIARTMFEVMV